MKNIMERELLKDNQGDQYIALRGALLLQKLEERINYHKKQKSSKSLGI